MDLMSLYDLAERDGIIVNAFSLDGCESLAVELNGRCYIAIDPFKLKSTADEKTKLGHELGHGETGSFYNCHSCFDERQRNETRATRWAIRHLVPFDDMRMAMRDGCVTPWELAERFGVTEDFIRQAYGYYTGPCGLVFQQI